MLPRSHTYILKSCCFSEKMKAGADYILLPGYFSSCTMILQEGKGIFTAVKTVNLNTSCSKFWRSSFMLI